jgi:hypothetical protein
MTVVAWLAAVALAGWIGWRLRAPQPPAPRLPLGELERTLADYGRALQGATFTGTSFSYSDNWDSDAGDVAVRRLVALARSYASHDAENHAALPVPQPSHF